MFLKPGYVKSVEYVSD